jgi:glycosyltransferase involved in cell wall biosynthesis
MSRHADAPVLVVASTFPQHDGDIRGRFLVDLLEALPYRFRVVCPRGADFGPLTMASTERLPFRSDGVFHGEQGALANLTSGSVRRRAVARSCLSMLTTALRAARGCRLVWSHWAVPGGIVGSLCKLLTGIPHVLLLHSADVWLLENRRWGRFVARWIAAHTDRLFGVNAAVIERFARLSGRRGEVLGCGAARNVETRPTGSVCRVGLLSRLVPSKGVVRLLDSASPIDAEIHVAGAGPRAARVASSCSRLPRAVFHGPVTGRAKRRLLAAVDVFVAPYVAAPWGQTEGTPVSVLEAMAAGCAVVAFRSAIPKDLIVSGEQGILVPDGDFPALVETIRELVRDPQRCGRLGAAARSHVEPLLLDRVAPRWATVLEDSAFHLQRKDREAREVGEARIHQTPFEPRDGAAHPPHAEHAGVQGHDADSRAREQAAAVRKVSGGLGG